MILWLGYCSLPCRLGYGGFENVCKAEELMSEFSKWEQNSIKTSVVLPIVFLVTAIILVIVLSLLQPPPPEVKKKDSSVAAEIEQAAKQEEIDWSNF
jgi:hypothetical protein